MLKCDAAISPAQIISAAVISPLSVLIPICEVLADDVVWDLATTNFD
jgi:hypothetical protein